jgi:hypothetical protein
MHEQKDAISGIISHKYRFVLTFISTTGGAIVNKKILIGIVAVIAIIIAAAVVMSNNDSSNPNDGEYNYSLDAMNSFVGWNTITYTAETGTEFIVATITLKNVKYSNGIDADPFNVKLKVGEVLYGHVAATYPHPGYGGNVSIMKGSQHVFTVVYQIPIAAGINYKVVWDGTPSNVIYNSALV